MARKRALTLRSGNLGPESQSERPSKKLRLSSPPMSPRSPRSRPRKQKSTRSRVSPSPSVKSEQSQTERIEDTIICAPIESWSPIDEDESEADVDIEEPTTRSLPFDQVLNAPSKNTIIQFPKGHGSWFILRCDQHDLDFRHHPLRAASAHLRSKQHGRRQDTTAPAVIEHLGIRVLNCNEELAQMNNAAALKFKPAMKHAGARHVEKVPEQPAEEPVPEESMQSRKKRKLSSTPSLEEQRPVEEQPVDEEQPAEDKPKQEPSHDPIISPTPGIVYLAYRETTKTWLPALLLPRNNLDKVGISATLEDLGLLEHVPKCYVYDPGTKYLEWKPEYEDGGSLIAKRQFPVAYFGATNFPSREAAAWVGTADLQELDLSDASSRLVPHFSSAREYVANRLEDCGSGPAPAEDDFERQPSLPATVTKTESPVLIIPEPTPAKEPVVVSVIAEKEATPPVEAPEPIREASVESESKPTLVAEPVLETPDTKAISNNEVNSNSELLCYFEPIESPEPANDPDLISDAETISNPETIVDTETVIEPETIIEPETLIDSEPVSKQEPITSPEPMIDSEIIESPQHEKSPEPISNPEPMEIPEPINDPEPANKFNPVNDPEPIESEPMDSLELTNETQIINSPEPANIPEPINNSIPINNLEPMETTEPINNPKPKDHERINSPEAIKNLEPTITSEHNTCRPSRDNTNTPNPIHNSEPVNSPQPMNDSYRAPSFENQYYRPAESWSDQPRDLAIRNHYASYSPASTNADYAPTPPASEILSNRHCVERALLNHMSADLFQLKAKSTDLMFPKAVFDMEPSQSTLPPIQQLPSVQEYSQPPPLPTPSTEIFPTPGISHTPAPSQTERPSAFSSPAPQPSPVVIPPAPATVARKRPAAARKPVPSHRPTANEAVPIPAVAKPAVAPRPIAPQRQPPAIAIAPRPIAAQEAEPRFGESLYGVSEYILQGVRRWLRTTEKNPKISEFCFSDGLYRCPWCHKRFARAGIFTDHLSLKHDQRPKPQAIRPGR